MANGVVGKLIASAVTEAASLGWNTINGQVSLSMNMEENYETLKEGVAKLRAIRDDHETAVQRQKTMTTSSRYSVWLNSVMRIIKEVENLEDLYEEDSKRSSNFRVPRRSNYSKKMAKKCEKVLSLIEEGNFIGGIFVDKPQEAVLKVNAPDIKGFPTLQRSLEDILDLLKNEKVKGIGIHGTLGVGKTSVMQNLNNHEEVAIMFDVVIWLKASTEDSKEKLQEEIVRRLKLNIDGIISDEVTKIISEELKNKKYLLLLDGVVDSIDLDEMGIPDNNNGSKVVLTTEFLHVCNSMAERVIEVHPLSPNEAWKMFEEIVTCKIIDLPDIEPVARLVARACSRLPLLIKTVASSFKSKDTDCEWRNGLEELRKWPEIEIKGLTRLHAFLKFCYDELKDEEKKRCFLHSALYPADSKIYTDYLLECWVAEGFLGDISDTRMFRKARDKGFSILKHLTNVSLLEKGERMISVQMSNSIRQFALTISSQDPECKFLVERGEKSPKPQTADDWRHAKRISMINNKLQDLPGSPSCSMLLSLLLQRNPDLATIPPSFFDNMKSLLLLDFYGTGIVSLPTSLSNLSGLKVLYLNDCIHLTELPPQVGELHQLEVLDIRGCKVIFIPLHIQNLVYLRVLRVSYYKSSDINDRQEVEIDRDVISKLSRLEELIIDVKSYYQWCNEAADVIRQVAALENLTTLRICFPESQILKTFMENSLSWRDRQQLTSFRFFVGCQTWKRPRILEYFGYKINRYMRYCYGNEVDDSKICDVLAEVDALELSRHEDIMRLSDFEGTASLNRVRGCLIERCNKIITIADGNMTSGDILPKLEQLHLMNLPSLQSIFEGHMSSQSLSRLQTLVVIGCPRLTKFFSNEMIQRLLKLQNLTVAGCSEIEELIMTSEVLRLESCVLPNLETLVLHGIPKLRTICEHKFLTWPSLKLLKIHGCPELKMLPLGKNSAPKLKSIEGEKTWWDALQWHDNEARDQLPFAASA